MQTVYPLAPPPMLPQQPTGKGKERERALAVGSAGTPTADYLSPGISRCVTYPSTGVQSSLSSHFRGVALPGAHGPGCLAALCGLRFSYALVHASEDQIFGFAARATDTASARSPLKASAHEWRFSTPGPFQSKH
eukprot:1047312-Pleurochrysis_carterae.AAC.1